MPCRALPAAVALAVLAPVAACTSDPPFQHLAGPGKATLVAYHADLAELPRFTVLRDPAIRPRKPPAAKLAVRDNHHPRPVRGQPTNQHRSAPSVPVAPGGEAVITALLCMHSYEGSWTAATGNGFYGGLQDLPSTWNYAAAHSGFPGYANGRADLAPPAVQVAVNAWLFTHSNPHQQWPLSSRRCGV